MCIMEPDFPKFADANTLESVNYTSSYKYGSGVPTKDVSFCGNLLGNVYTEIMLADP